MEAGRRFTILPLLRGNERSPRVDRRVGGTVSIRVNAGWLDANASMQTQMQTQTQDGWTQVTTAFDSGCSLQAFGEVWRSCAVQATKCQYTVGTVSARGLATNAGRGEAEWCGPTVAQRKSAELQRSELTGACQGDDWRHRSAPNSSSRSTLLTTRALMSVSKAWCGKHRRMLRTSRRAAKHEWSAVICSVQADSAVQAAYNDTMWIIMWIQCTGKYQL